MRKIARFLPLCLLLIACDSSSPASGGAESDVADTSTVSDTGNGSGSGDTGSDTSQDTAQDTTPDGGGAGTPCLENSDCASSICLSVDAQGNGVCVTPCTTATDCAGGEECVLFPGTDPQRVCVVGDLCIDLDGDLAGAGAGCALPDCDDSNAAISPTSPETCNGVDDNCDRLVDNGIPAVGDACNTGFSGLCAAGTLQCTGALVCQPNNPSTDELCNLADDDCDGEVDESAGCFDTGVDCAEDADCATGLICRGGICVLSQLCGNELQEGSEACDDGNTATERCGYGETSCVVCDELCRAVSGAVDVCGDVVTNAD